MSAAADNLNKSEGDVPDRGTDPGAGLRPATHQRKIERRPGGDRREHQSPEGVDGEDASSTV